MDDDSLTNAVRSHFREHAARYGLRTTDVRVEPVLNWGGSVSVHFDVSDGERGYHLKLTRDRQAAADLRRWRTVSHRLEARYRAPRIVDHIQLDAIDAEGLLFEKFSGAPVDLPSSLPLLDPLLNLVEALHRDLELERMLANEGVVGDARGSIRERTVDSFEADLAESGDRYPVSCETLDWMHHETATLRRLIEAEAAFDRVRPVPIHGDLWAGNILVDASGRCVVLDWDDLSLGDPVLDYAVLLWPILRAGSHPTRWLGARAKDAGFMTRFQLCVRASLLDEVIDSLADWVEADAISGPIERVRAVKLEMHRRALVDYRRRYAP